MIMYVSKYEFDCKSDCNGSMSMNFECRLRVNIWLWIWVSLWVNMNVILRVSLTESTRIKMTEYEHGCTSLIVKPSDGMNVSKIMSLECWLQVKGVVQKS